MFGKLTGLFGRNALPKAKPGSERGNFLQRYGHLPIERMIADWREVQLHGEDHAWASFPPGDFLDFCRGYEKTPFDAVHVLPCHKKPPSFLVAQAHRIWQTTSLTHRRLIALQAENFLDLGSFPFFASLTLRDYFGYKGRITVTTNRTLPPDDLDFLNNKGIAVQLLDLDPFVHDPHEAEALPARLDAADASFDLVLCSHVIEHLYHPKSMLEESNRLLRDGGEMVITTDNAMMLDVFANYVGGLGYTFEPVETTAAMTFHSWRGHVRFFTSQDLNTLLKVTGFTPTQVEYFHCFYDTLFEDYFEPARPRVYAWQLPMLAETPWLRNDMAVIGRKVS